MTYETTQSDVTEAQPAPANEVPKMPVMARLMTSLLQCYRTVNRLPSDKRDVGYQELATSFGELALTLVTLGMCRPRRNPNAAVTQAIFTIWSRQETLPVTVDDALAALLPFEGMTDLSNELQREERAHLGLNWLSWSRRYGWDWFVTDSMLRSDNYRPYQVLVEFFDGVNHEALEKLNTWVLAAREHILRDGCLTDGVYSPADSV